jgi:hypothetical protein
MSTNNIHHYQYKNKHRYGACLLLSSLLAHPVENVLQPLLLRLKLLIALFQFVVRPLST